MTTMNAGNPASSVTEAEEQLQGHLERKVFSAFLGSSFLLCRVSVSGRDVRNRFLFLFGFGSIFEQKLGLGLE